MRHNLKLSSNTRAAIYARTAGRCWYCGIKLTMHGDNETSSACLDHANPHCQGGSNRRENLLPSCRFCNCQKSGKNIEAYRTYLQTKRSPAFRAAQLLREALTECSTPFNRDLLNAIDWLDQSVEPLRFWGEAKAGAE